MMRRVRGLLACTACVWAISWAPAVLAQDWILVEPSQNVGGSPLDDLASCTVVITRTRTGETGHEEFAASNPSGGGRHDVVVAGVFGYTIEGEVSAYGICVDLDGNTSEASAVRTKTFPPLAPMAPQLDVVVE